ncbi:flavohemoglobin expression-modulating QEGLA motif protein [Pleionea sediminis]|uniref:flavohemoglobin expression-modulating QEGLA motif protein n=1 Tax=Pleionea sediminis TaxID=2569479 RepID=UPI0011864E81|nr:flavohemoglobin expression-modulating QEGLA motif protein [Pleionea sediminis]
MSQKSTSWETRERARLCKLSDELLQVGKNIQVLSLVGWPISAKQAFFDAKAEKLPEVTYEPFEGKPARDALNKLKTQLGDTPADNWMEQVCDILLTTIDMLDSRGTSGFFENSKMLYGEPKALLKDEKTSALDLARRYLELLKPISKMDLGEPPEACILASTLAEEMRQVTSATFGNEAPEILVVEDLSANALASAEKVRIRRTACFSDNDIKQLIEHEIYIHVATILNGRTEGNLSLLSLAHPGATKTQEGLAVFAEYITGTLDLDRMTRLADRVVAIQMAIDGANFIDVYRYFLERTNVPDQSYESTRRVFRGGVISGGAPFTKDIVYLDGLLRVHNFMKAAVNHGRADAIQLLFAGRLDIEDLPTLSYLRSLGLCRRPRFLPKWASDLRFLLCYLSYSSFLNSIDMSKVYQHYHHLLSNVGEVY